MKIICIGRNYLNSTSTESTPSQPLFFLKPETSMVTRNRPFFYPEFSKEIFFELELVLRINKVGKHIQERFAHTYYDAIGLGIDFTAMDVLRECQQKGNPWDIAKAFDDAAAVSDFMDKNEFQDLQNIHFQMNKNGECVQDGCSSNMIFNFNQIISYVSNFVTLKIGDLIFTGTPAGAGPVAINDLLEGYIEGKKLLSCRIK